MQRIVVVGSSGSGKTTIARRIGEILQIPTLEMDSVARRLRSSDEVELFLESVEAKTHS